MKPGATIYIVDDDPAIRQSLGLMLQNDYRVMTVPSAEAFLELESLDEQGCVLLDLRMPGMSGLELQRRLAERNISIPIVFMTGHGGVSECVQAMRGGAVHFLEKPFSGETLHRCLTEGLEEAMRRAKCAARQEDLERRLEKLTAREAEVMQLMVTGLSNKEIARELDISFRTVEKHRSEVLHKLGMGNTVELARCFLTMRPFGETG